MCTKDHPHAPAGSLALGTLCVPFARRRPTVVLCARGAPRGPKALALGNPLDSLGAPSPIEPPRYTTYGSAATLRYTMQHYVLQRIPQSTGISHRNLWFLDSETLRTRRAFRATLNPESSRAHDPFGMLLVILGRQLG